MILWTIAFAGEQHSTASEVEGMMLRNWATGCGRSRPISLTVVGIRNSANPNRVRSSLFRWASTKFCLEDCTTVKASLMLFS
jgi:hypothetical protein